MANDSPLRPRPAGRVQDDLRHQVARALVDRSAAIAADSVAVFPFSGVDRLDPAYCHQVGQLLVELLAAAVRNGHADPRGGSVADLHRIVQERALSVERLFTFAYLVERGAVDELALDESIGATSEPWPVVAQLVRRGCFDLLGAYVGRTEFDPPSSAITDKLTTLYTRPLFEAVLTKEVERAGRFGFGISLILFDVDRLSDINEAHGYGVGDKILERLGILIRKYFRQQDWVARHSEDSIAVLLTHTDPDHAADLANKVRTTVQERLGFVDHRDNRAVDVSLSAAVVNMQLEVGEFVDADRLLADAEGAVERAKQQGRNRVERVDGYSGRKRN